MQIVCAKSLKQLQDYVEGEIYIYGARTVAMRTYDYLVNNDNYRIYHSPDDFFATEGQIKRLKTLAGKHLVCVSNGSHLGFLYRKEFQEALKADVLGKI